MIDAAQKPNVFLAYAAGDESRARPIINGLLAHGFSVLGTHESIPIGADWARVLNGQLAAAQCIVVLWSRTSARSDWVLSEAQLALRRNIFLPVTIEPVELPAGFRLSQAVTLVGWIGSPYDGSFMVLVEGIRQIIASAPEEMRLQKESQRRAEVRAENLFQQNLHSELALEYVDLRKTLFHDDLNWNVTPGVNVLLGRNGFGKTLFLRSVLSVLQYDDDAARQTLGEGSAEISVLIGDCEKSIRFSDQFFDEESMVGRMPVLAIPDTRFIDRSVTILRAVADEGISGRDDRVDLARLGARHFLTERPYDGMIQSFLYGLCLDYFEDERSFRGEQFALVRGVVRELTDQTFDFVGVERAGRDRFTLYVRTEGNEDNPLPIQKCSQGTSSVIAMFGLIYDYLKSLRHEGVPEVRKRRGIVVIDEVDAHLHPLWQQKIVTLLRDRFPRVQFILTAHNPIVVAGCREDEVSVLRRSPTRGFSLVQFPNDFIGWQTEAIYRKVFEIESPDASFTRLDAMRPFKARLREEADALARKEGRSADEERALEALEDDLLHIEKVEQTRARKLTLEELERENKMLRDKLGIRREAE